MRHRRQTPLFAAIVAGLAAGCAPARTLPAVRPPAVSPSPVTPALARAVVETALGLVGQPYRNGASGPSAFDCSGFVQFVFAAHGVGLPRATTAQSTAGHPLDPAGIRAGDLLFFSTTGPGPTHVAIALGDGRFVHAPSGRGVVRVEGLSGSYWPPRFIGARRVLPER